MWSILHAPAGDARRYQSRIYAYLRLLRRDLRERIVEAVSHLLRVNFVAILGENTRWHHYLIESSGAHAAIVTK